MILAGESIGEDVKGKKKNRIIKFFEKLLKAKDRLFGSTGNSGFDSKSF